MMRYLNLAAVIASASLAASCGLAPSMKTYDYPNLGFTADFPSQPTVKAATDPRTGAPTTVIDSQSLGRDFAITVTKVDPKRDIDQLADDASQATAKIVGGEVTYRTYAATPEGAMGREQIIGKNGGRAVRARYYLSGDRFYSLTAKSVMGLNPTAESSGEDTSAESPTDEDPGVKAFLTSFHVTPAEKR